QEFGWTDRTATNYIRVYEMMAERNFEKFSKLSLPVSSLYLLAAPSTPIKTRDAVLEQAAAGEKVSVLEVKEKIAAAKRAGNRPGSPASGRAKAAQKKLAEPPDFSKAERAIRKLLEPFPPDERREICNRAIEWLEGKDAT